MGFPKKRTRVCFIHVPKCGGTSLDIAIQKAMNCSPLKFDSYTISPSKTKKQAAASGKGIFEQRQKVLDSKLRSIRLKYLRGHSRCPSELRQKFEDRWIFLTVLRNPVDRFISHYFYNRYKESGHFKHDLSIDEYLLDPLYAESGSEYLTYFSDDPDGNKKDRTHQAIENLKHFHLVGILENLHPFQAQLRERFKIDIDSLEHSNINPISKEEMQEAFTDEQMAKINQLCAYDLEVYNHFAKPSPDTISPI